MSSRPALMKHELNFTELYNASCLIGVYMFSLSFIHHIDMMQVLKKIKR